jgi:hypothetical protein
VRTASAWVLCLKADKCYKVPSIVNSVADDATSEGESFLSDAFRTSQSNSARQLGPLPPRPPLLLNRWRRKQHHSLTKLPHESHVRPSAR